jgi:hypothetical protein
LICHVLSADRHEQLQAPPLGCVEIVAHLNATELRQFNAQALALHAKRPALSVTQEEAEMPLPNVMLKRSAMKSIKNTCGFRLPHEPQPKTFDVACIEVLSRVAAGRGVTLSALIRELEMAPPADA